MTVDNSVVLENEEQLCQPTEVEQLEEAIHKFDAMRQKLRWWKLKLWNILYPHCNAYGDKPEERENIVHEAIRRGIEPALVDMILRLEYMDLESAPEWIRDERKHPQDDNLPF